MWHPTSLRKTILSLAFTAMFLFPALSARALDFRVALIHGDPAIFAYELSVIQLALDQFPSEHTMTIVPMPGHTQERIFYELAETDGRVDLYFTGPSAERERNFQQIDIPLTRGLLGHRIFIINKKDQDLLKQVQTLKDAQEILVVGSGVGWPDTSIFKNSGFEVQAATYQSLWKMLARGRYNAFNRGIHEAYVEIEQQTQNFPDLMVDSEIMVVFPLDYLIYLRKDDVQRGKVLTEGLLKAYENGSFMENFQTHPMIRKALADANPADRRIFYIENHLLTKRQKSIPEKFWHRF